jgi:hypothetical protein
MSRRLTGDIAFDVNDLDALSGLLNVPVTAFFDAAYSKESQVSAASTSPCSLTLPLLTLAAA